MVWAAGMRLVGAFVALRPEDGRVTDPPLRKTSWGAGMSERGAGFARMGGLTAWRAEAWARGWDAGFS